MLPASLAFNLLNPSKNVTVEMSYDFQMTSKEQNYPSLSITAQRMRQNDKTFKTELQAGRGVVEYGAE